METKELKIQIPKGYEIDKDKSTFEKIIFKKKDTKPRSWEDYLELNTGFDGAGIDWNCGGVQTTGLHHRGKAIVPTNLAAPFIAMMQLMSLRQSWIGDWKPDWTNDTDKKWCVVFQGFDVLPPLKQLESSTIYATASSLDEVLQLLLSWETPFPHEKKSCVWFFTLLVASPQQPSKPQRTNSVLALPSLH